LISHAEGKLDTMIFFSWLFPTRNKKEKGKNPGWFYLIAFSGSDQVKGSGEGICYDWT